MNNYLFGQISVGLSESFQVLITPDMIDKFREISGDHNPLHRDKEFAQHRGHRECVVFGMLTASFYSTLVGVYIPGCNALLHQVDAYFISPVYSEDVLRISGKVAAVHHSVNCIDIRAEIANQNGIRVSRANIRVGVDKYA